MFDPSDHARVFGLAPGVDFPVALADGLRARLTDAPPDAMARVDLIVNTRRMARRLREIFDKGPAGFLPRIRLLGELDTLVPGVTAPPAIPALQRRLELIQLLSGLLEADPTLAPRASLYALSDSLAALMDEMQGEGVDIRAIENLDVSDQSGHWDRAKRFLEIAHSYLGQTGSAPDAEARQRQLTLQIIAAWQANPPQNPVILAGSTGSRGTTSLLMQAVAKLPQGALVLPGFDFDMPTSVWAQLDQELLSEDHPQYRFRHLMQALELPRRGILPWAEGDAPSPTRNALVSLSLRPAPVTHAWLSEGPNLTDLAAATQGITLVEAPTPRIEALTIALRLRKAVEEGKTVALITPDRMLTRQVTSALDRWNILPDDSAGMPLQLSPPGRFLRHVAALFLRKMDAEALLTLLKHPLTHSGADRNLHQLHTQRLEMQIRRDGLPYPDPDGLARIAQKAADRIEEPAAFLDWAAWVGETFCDHATIGDLALTTWVQRHLDLANAIASGPTNTPDHELWRRKPGQAAEKLMTDLTEQAVFGGSMSAADFSDLLGAVLSGGEVRDRDAPHPGVMIWGTLEARVQGADLVIMGGLNDGTWPEAPPPDPWLNRQMRLQAGLLLPERRIGLSAHDYQQAIAAPEVWITRAIRSDEAETVPSRWLNRLGNLLNGLPQEDGARAWSDMRARGQYWTKQVQALEETTRSTPAPRPSPRPPVTARPHALSVTEIKRLIRDPYAIYAKHTLRLRQINPLVQSPDAPVRGIILHEIMERFVKSVSANAAHLTKEHLLAIAREVLEAEAPWPAARAMWLARIERVADWFIAQEAKRQSYSSPVAFEKAARGKHIFETLGFTLTGFADRIDLTDAGDALIYDYKTGTPPSKKEQKLFDKQLLIEAAMVEEGGFSEVGTAPVANAIFIGLGSKPVEISAPLDEEPPAEVLAGLEELIASYLSAAQGFTSRRMVKTEEAAGDYDQLARFGEWDGTTLATPEDLT
ncbi:double-strand break repair protein AddB [Sulfitobacter mediterraneus]|uniref:double-strand break repair protein AddB n=1 Tax=Sulfitobacter mediterraneus TaxID=83219 RepID=UPI0019333E55|nr:double-strand break repair protein AddB [Sulfitobacter mediterraneus]MBM1308638.1 double-strand break repair protein AddB [Sulfitobacter mediterraneus]MBM1312523.1 double-strand break repair protein AddB [Sulfitobacter mediterraneus]MBM1320904.1 double-strand break repair protein AddB [Sulfitobacter mediterraneus]MBM1324792.1 double-strand break repair protein AddB [Sulfitobacter mediterraneus]MBM1396138.1 double-strand break repair protein AddB [Sulfitobacter mediterraneus]